VRTTSGTTVVFYGWTVKLLCYFSVCPSDVANPHLTNYAGSLLRAMVTTIEAVRNRDISTC
jgi:hypothetical protein